MGGVVKTVSAQLGFPTAIKAPNQFLDVRTHCGLVGVFFRRAGGFRRQTPSPGLSILQSKFLQ